MSVSQPTSWATYYRCSNHLFSQFFFLLSFLPKVTTVSVFSLLSLLTEMLIFTRAKVYTIQYSGRPKEKTNHMFSAVKLLAHFTIRLIASKTHKTSYLTLPPIGLPIQFSVHLTSAIQVGRHNSHFRGSPDTDRPNLARETKRLLVRLWRA